MTEPTPPSPSPPDRGKDAGVYSIIAVVAIIIFSLIGWGWARSERADLAQWLTAVSSAATLVAAIIAASFAAGAFRLETTREERYREDQRRQQAERFAAWYDIVQEGVRINDDPPSWTVTSRVIQVRNASDLPVTSITFTLFHEGDEITTHWVPIVPPSTEPIPLYLTQDSLAALDEMDAALLEGHEEPYPHNLDVDLTFTDAAGRLWYRRHDGDLQQIPQES